ncbi:hypothetical protein A5320_18850 [Rheinheimera sp. SA_1]|nr:hypothetical protein A5320_18850 [Rheinheimera sp. SA_1]
MLVNQSSLDAQLFSRLLTTKRSVIAELLLKGLSLLINLPYRICQEKDLEMVAATLAIFVAPFHTVLCEPGGGKGCICLTDRY